MPGSQKIVIIPSFSVGFTHPIRFLLIKSLTRPWENFRRVFSAIPRWTQYISRLEEKKSTSKVKVDEKQLPSLVEVIIKEKQLDAILGHLPKPHGSWYVSLRLSGKRNQNFNKITMKTLSHHPHQKKLTLRWRLSSKVQTQLFDQHFPGVPWNAAPTQGQYNQLPFHRGCSNCFVKPWLCTVYVWVDLSILKV